MSPLVFNILDYGADEDDPAANHAALNTACDLASSWGGEVFVPAGKWELDRSGVSWAWAVLGNNYRIRGVRGQSWIKLKAGQSSTPCVTVLVDGNCGIEFCDIGFDGNWGNGRTSVAMSMVGLSLPEGTIEVAEGTDNFPASGTFWIVLAGGDAQVITYTGKTDGSFTGCTGGSGIIQRGALIGRQDSIGGINHGDQGDPKSHGVMLRGAVDVRFERCMWRQCYGDGVWIGASVTTFYASKDVTFVDCRMDVCARDGAALAGICSGIKIDRTRFENIFAQAVDSEPVETWVRDVTVRDSFLGGWWNPGNPDRSGNAPLSIAGGKDTFQWRETATRAFRILNCELQGAAVLGGCTNVVIRDCSFVSTWDGDGYPLIYIIGHVEDVWIVDNHLYSRVAAVGGAADAVIVARYNAFERRNVQPTGVHIKGNRIHGRNGRDGIRITGPGGSAVTLDGNVRTSLDDDSGTAESIDFSTTVAAGSAGQILSPAPINVDVASTTGAPDHGTFRITTKTPDGVRVTRVITYTGKNATQFTGCTGRSDAMATGDPVAISLLTDNHKLWEVDQWANFRLLVRNRTGVIRSNTDQKLTLYDTLSDQSFFAVTGWGDPYNGDPVPSPSAGAYKIIAPSRGFITIEGNDIDLSDDGNGGGRNGIIVEAHRAQARVKLINNTIKCADGAAICIRGPATANEPPTQREFKHLEIADNHAYDDRKTPLTTALLEFKDNPSWAKMILRNNSVGVGVTDHTVGLTSGVWLTEDGSPPKWTGYGSPEGVISGPVGTMYHRRDGSSGSTLYVKQSGTGNTGWAPLTTSS